MILDEISDFIELNLGVLPVKLERMGFGHSNEVYDVTLPNENVIVRINVNADKLKHTKRNIAVLASLGLPVPKVLASDLSATRYSSAIMILEKIPGRDLRFELPTMTCAQMSKVAQNIVSFQRTVATLPKGNAYGWAAIGENGSFPTWTHLVERDTKENLSKSSTYLTDIHVKKIQQQFDTLQVYLDSVDPTCFLDDITIKNVIVNNGELQGLIDFDWVCYGDALYMIALTQTAIYSDVSQAGVYYIDELCRHWNITEEQRAVINFYSVVHGLSFIYHHTVQRDYSAQARVLESIDEWIKTF